MNLLKQLKTQTKVVADSGDFESIKKFNPVDSTTNPSLIYAAAQDNKYSYLIDEALAFAKSKTTDNQKQLSIATDRLFVDFGLEILKIVPGRVSTEVDARLSFDTEASVRKARKLIVLYNSSGTINQRGHPLQSDVTVFYASGNCLRSSGGTTHFAICRKSSRLAHEKLSWTGIN